MITKTEIDEIAAKYETIEFFEDDPIRFPNKFTDKKDKEIAGFIASLAAYGRREVFIKKLNQLFDIAQNEPYNFILNFEPKILGDFNYRFGKPEDFAQIFTVLKKLYKENGGLEELFKYGYEISKKGSTATDDSHESPDIFGSGGKKGSAATDESLNSPDIFGSGGEKGSAATGESLKSSTAIGAGGKNMFLPVTDYFYSQAEDNSSMGFRFMIPDARKGSAMKRMCMYLRWMVRKGPVDFGIWNFMPASDLYIPLDTHVARISRKMGLLTRNSNDFKSVIELTENLKQFDKDDPVKYDFALFGYGVNNK